MASTASVISELVELGKPTHGGRREVHVAPFEMARGALSRPREREHVERDVETPLVRSRAGGARLTTHMLNAPQIGAELVERFARDGRRDLIGVLGEWTRPCEYVTDASPLRVAN